eukprot:144087_1
MASKLKYKDIDFNIFNNESTECKISETNEIIHCCSYLQRIAMGLKYYDTICKDYTLVQSVMTKSLVNQFYMETYRDFLDDFCHFLKHHNVADQLIKIEKELKNKYKFKTCNILNCTTLTRHYRENQNVDSIVSSDDGNITNAKFNFYSNCYDRLHHHIFHILRMGLKLQSIKTSHSDLQDYDSKCFDEVFNKQMNEIKKYRHKFDIQRYNQQNNKYNLSINDISSKNYNTSGGSCANTYLDEVYDFIEQHTDLKQVWQLREYINQNEYDSDAIKQDLERDVYMENAGNALQSNIFNDIKSQLCIVLLRGIILSSKSFSTGFIFYYDWKRYTQMTKYEIQRNDEKYKYKLQNGYSISQLLLLAHYKTLKEEIIESGFVNHKQWNEIVVLKAEEYFQIKNVKKMVCEISSYHDLPFTDWVHISLSQLTCVILYCDWSNLCTAFSATFRKQNQFETITSVKHRHSKYFHFAKGLVECVHDFGLIGCNTLTRDFGEHGPFYCGLNLVLNVPSFSINLKAPCSTSKDIEIAMNFASGGMIMQLQNNFAAGKCATFFDCSFVSNYSEENERLFIAESCNLKIESIIIIKTAKNFEDIIHALHLFDHMISGAKCRENVHISKSDVEILDILINNKLMMLSTTECKKSEPSIDPYVANIFDVFLHKKLQIEIYLLYLENYFKKISHLVVHNVKYTGSRRRERRNTQAEENNVDLVNMFNVKILSIFPNVTEVIIHTTGESGTGYGYDPEYSFDILSFLSSIKSSKSSVKYIIEAKLYNERNKPWFSKCHTEPLQSTIEVLLDKINWYMQCRRETWSRNRLASWYLWIYQEQK